MARFILVSLFYFFSCQSSADNEVVSDIRVWTYNEHSQLYCDDEGQNCKPEECLSHEKKSSSSGNTTSKPNKKPSITGINKCHSERALSTSYECEAGLAEACSQILDGGEEGQPSDVKGRMDEWCKSVGGTPETYTYFEYVPTKIQGFQRKKDLIRPQVECGIFDKKSKVSQKVKAKGIAGQCAKIEKIRSSYEHAKKEFALSVNYECLNKSGGSIPLGDQLRLKTSAK